jgi:hypothetical protein
LADSTTNLDTISSSQTSKEVTANALFDAMSSNALFGRHASTTSALSWGYYGGKYPKADGTILTVANAVLSLTASATNYIKETAGVVSVTTSAPSGWPGPLSGGARALYAVVCGSSSVTSYTDYRTPLQGPAGAAGATGSTGAAGAGVPAGGTTGQQLKKNSGTDYDTSWVSEPYDVAISFSAVPTASQILLKMTMTRAVTFAANLAGSKPTAADVAATASTTVSVKKNGSQVATLVYAVAGTTPTLATSGGTAVSFAADDVLSVVAPVTPDATLSGIYAVLAGLR